MKPWNEYPPETQGRINALVLDAIKLGHTSVMALAAHAGITWVECEQAIRFLVGLGELDAARAKLIRRPNVRSLVRAEGERAP